MAGFDTGARALPVIAIWKPAGKWQTKANFGRVSAAASAHPGNLHQCQLGPQMLLKSGDQLLAIHTVIVE